VEAAADRVAHLICVPCCFWSRNTPFRHHLGERVRGIRGLRQRLLSKNLLMPSENFFFFFFFHEVMSEAYQFCPLFCYHFVAVWHEIVWFWCGWVARKFFLVLSVSRIYCTLIFSWASTYSGPPGASSPDICIVSRCDPLAYLTHITRFLLRQLASSRFLT